MTIEEIKAELQRKIEECDKDEKTDLWDSEFGGQSQAYKDALSLLNNWNGK